MFLFMIHDTNYQPYKYVLCADFDLYSWLMLCFVLVLSFCGPLFYYCIGTVKEKQCAINNYLPMKTEILLLLLGTIYIYYQHHSCAFLLKMMIMVDKILCKECFIFNGGDGGSDVNGKRRRACDVNGLPFFFALYYCIKKKFNCKIAKHPQTIDVTDTLTCYSHYPPIQPSTHYYIKPLRKIMNNKDFKNKQKKSLNKH